MRKFLCAVVAVIAIGACTATAQASDAGTLAVAGAAQTQAGYDDKCRDHDCCYKDHDNCGDWHNGDHGNGDWHNGDHGNGDWHNGDRDYDKCGDWHHDHGNGH